MPLAEPALQLRREQYLAMLAHCLDGYPDEACGMLGGPLDATGRPTGDVTATYPCRNANASARTYTVDSRDLLKALRDAEDRGGDVIGVWHSHTHSDAYPSATDIRQAVDPRWYYVIISLQHADPALRAFHIRDGVVEEAAVTVAGITAP